MKTSTIVWLIVIIVIVLGGWYWFASMGSGASSNEQNTSQTENTPNVPTASSTSQSGDGSDISANLTLGTDSTTTLGTYLIGYTGMTLYSFSKDGNATSTCYGACATAWPPYVVPAGMQLNLQSGVRGTASTILRADGSTQVTYNGKPLYFYSGDTTGSDTEGQGVGKLWSVVKP